MVALDPAATLTVRLRSRDGSPLAGEVIVSVAMPPSEEVESYEAFAFHTGVQVVVRRLDTGEEGQLPSFDGLVEFEGRWKLLNYDEL